MNMVFWRLPDSLNTWLSWLVHGTNARYSFVKISCHSSKFDVRCKIWCCFSQLQTRHTQGSVDPEVCQGGGRKAQIFSIIANPAGRTEPYQVWADDFISLDSNLISASFPGISMRTIWLSYPSPRYPGQRRGSFVDKMLRKRPFSHFTTDSTFLMTVIIPRNYMLLMRYELCWLQVNKSELFRRRRF